MSTYPLSPAPASRLLSWHKVSPTLNMAATCPHHLPESAACICVPCRVLVSDAMSRDCVPPFPTCRPWPAPSSMLDHGGFVWLGSLRFFVPLSPPPLSARPFPGIFWCLVSLRVVFSRKVEGAGRLHYLSVTRSGSRPPPTTWPCRQSLSPPSDRHLELRWKLILKKNER